MIDIIFWNKLVLGYPGEDSQTEDLFWALAESIETGFCPYAHTHTY